jgi:hypothetical protein
MLTHKRPIAGTCPSCGECVYTDEPDGPVWTCPRDLSPKNPYWKAPSPLITEALHKRTGVYSQCLEDYDADDVGVASVCYDRMPLHSACYDKGDY